MKIDRPGNTKIFFSLVLDCSVLVSTLLSNQLLTWLGKGKVSVTKRTSLLPKPRLLQQKHTPFFYKNLVQGLVFKFLILKLLLTTFQFLKFLNSSIIFGRFSGQKLQPTKKGIRIRHFAINSDKKTCSNTKNLRPGLHNVKVNQKSERSCISSPLIMIT